MAAVDKFRKYKSLYSSTTNSFGSGDSETITPASVDGLPTDTDITLTFDRTVTGKVERIIGAISGGNFVSNTSPTGRGTDSTTDQAHTSPTVEMVWNSADWNDAIDGILVGHTQTGLHDFNGGEVTIDADADTTMTADTDDRIDWKLGGSDRFRMGVSDLDIVTATGNIQVAGADPKRGIYIPANGMIAATTNGAASGQTESSTNKVNFKTLDFDASTDEYACFNIPAPDYWDLGTVTAQFYWTAASGATSNTVVYGMQGLALSNDDAIDTAYGTAVNATADNFIAASDVHVTAATGAITIAGTPAKGDMLFFRVLRDVSEDDLPADAKLIGVKVKFSVSQFSDE